MFYIFKSYCYYKFYLAIYSFLTFVPPQGMLFANEFIASDRISINLPKDGGFPVLYGKGDENEKKDACGDPASRGPSDAFPDS